MLARIIPIVLLLATAIAEAPPVARPAATGLLTVTTLNCAENLGAVPELSYLKMNNRALPHGLLHGPMGLSRSITSSGQKIARGVYHFSLQLPPGNYEVYGSAKDCFGGQVMAVVLAGHARSTSLVLGDAWTMMFDHDHAGLAGTIGLEGTRLELLDPDGSYGARFVDVENGAFYVDSLQRKRWVLRVWVDCCRHSDFPIDLSGVHPGDYVTVALTASDVFRRIGYTGSLFSDPLFVAGSSSGAWYVNTGRSTVGIAKLDGTHKEFMLSPGHSPQFIIADGSGGAWFSESDNMIGHVDENGALTEVAIRDATAAKSLHVNRLLLERGGTLLAMSADRVFRISAQGAVQELTVPPQVELGYVGVGPDGTAWFNVNDASHLAVVRGAAVELERPIPTNLAPGIIRVNDAFYSVKETHGGDALIGMLQQSTDDSWSDEDEAVGDRAGGVWIGNCLEGRIRHVDAVGKVTPFEDLGCPQKSVSDGNGGIWFIRDHASVLEHLSDSNVATTYALPSQVATPGNLTLDGEGVLWFPEHGVNRVAYFKDGRFGEIDLGNPGATPSLTIVP